MIMQRLNFDFQTLNCSRKLVIEEKHDFILLLLYVSNGSKYDQQSLEILRLKQDKTTPSIKQRIQENKTSLTSKCNKTLKI